MEDRVLDIVADIFDVSRDKLSATTELEHLEEWDSLQQINLVLALEQEFSVSFSAEEMASLTTVPRILERLTAG
jgi:acyl carrier protein